MTPVSNEKRALLIDTKRRVENESREASFPLARLRKRMLEGWEKAGGSMTMSV
jgi:hypothetical protein